MYQYGVKGQPFLILNEIAAPGPVGRWDNCMEGSVRNHQGSHPGHSIFQALDDVGTWRTSQSDPCESLSGV